MRTPSKIKKREKKGTDSPTNSTFHSTVLDKMRHTTFFEKRNQNLNIQANLGESMIVTPHKRFNTELSQDKSRE